MADSYQVDQPPLNITTTADGEEMGTRVTTTSTSAAGRRSRTPSLVRQARAEASDELFILVLGQSGVGKTSFIDAASKSTIRVSGTNNAGPEKVEISLPLYLDGKCIRLVDTPGFDDGDRSDTDVLIAISSYLATQYTNGKKMLAGIIYLHNIGAARLRGSSRRNLSLLTKLCGRQALPNVAIVTTRWDQVNQEAGDTRESQLQTRSHLLQPLLELGAVTFRYNQAKNGSASVEEVLRHFINRQPIPLLIQNEMVDNGQLIPATTAGRALQREYKARLDGYQKKMQDLRTEYDDLKNEKKLAAAKRVKSEMVEVKDKAEILKEESKKLSIANIVIAPQPQALRLLISPTSVVQPRVTSTSQPAPPARASSSSNHNFPPIPPLPVHPPSAMRTPMIADKGKGREVPALNTDIQPAHMETLPALPPVPRVRRRSTRHARPERERERERVHYRSRSRKRSHDEDFLVVEGWDDYRLYIFGLVMILILVPFVRRTQALAAAF